MTILNRLGMLFRSEANAAIDKVEDAEKMLNQSLLDMQEQLVTAKKQVALAIADEKRLAKQLEDEKAKAEDWEKKAEMAVRAGRDDLAKEALVRKQDHDKLVVGFREQWQMQKAAVDQLKDALGGLNNKIEEAKRKKNLLIARAKRAKAQKTIAETASGIGENVAFDVMSRMEEKIDQMEAEAKATYEIAQEASGDQLANKFRDLEVVEADDALAALKAKMGVGPAPAAIPSAPAPASAPAAQPAMVELEAELGAGQSAKASGPR